MARKKVLQRISPFAANLRSLRSQNSLTQAELSEAAAIHHRYLQDLEAGRKNPSITVAANLRTALDCSWDELLKGL